MLTNNSSILGLASGNVEEAQDYARRKTAMFNMQKEEELLNNLSRDLQRAQDMIR